MTGGTVRKKGIITGVNVNTNDGRELTRRHPGEHHITNNVYLMVHLCNFYFSDLTISAAISDSETIISFFNNPLVRKNHANRQRTVSDSGNQLHYLFLKKDSRFIRPSS